MICHYLIEVFITVGVFLTPTKLHSDAFLRDPFKILNDHNGDISPLMYVPPTGTPATVLDYVSKVTLDTVA